MRRDARDHLTDLLAETAAALGFCVGVLQEKAGDDNVPSWVHNALSHARSPMAAASIRERVALDHEALEEAERRRATGERMRLNGGGR
jgi:hypothetical protein